MRTHPRKRPLWAKRLAVAAVTTAVTAGLAVGPATMAPTASASGRYNQYQHTLVEGDRGTDVKALQFLLKARTFSAGDVDGVFGPDTKKAVEKFQRAKGLTVDGIVGPNTWTILHVTTSSSRGYKNDVRALQLLLGQKTKATLVKDGKFGPKTKSALRDFERAHGLKQDGVVTDSEWSRLLGHFEKTNSSALCRSSVVSQSNEQWGTSSTIGVIEKAAEGWNVARYGKATHEDISKVHGGDIANHTSHEVGLDADFSVFTKSKNQCNYRSKTWYGSYDRAATRAFIKRLKATGRVKVVYLNDDVLIREGLTERLASHDDHFHVRFKEHAFTHEGFSYR